jgi:hypothetical protein
MDSWWRLSGSLAFWTFGFICLFRISRFEIRIFESVRVHGSEDTTLAAALRLTCWPSYPQFGHRPAAWTSVSTGTPGPLPGGARRAADGKIPAALMYTGAYIRMRGFVRKAVAAAACRTDVSGSGGPRRPWPARQAELMHRLSTIGRLPETEQSV